MGVSFFGGDPTTKSTTDSSQATSFTPDNGLMNKWNDVEATGSGLANWWTNNAPPQATVADPGDLTNKYWQSAGGLGQFNTGAYTQPMQDVYNDMSLRQDPNNVSFKQDYNFQPGAVNFNDPWAAGVPQAGRGGGLGATAADYQIPTQTVNAQQFQNQQIAGPRPIDPITGLERVTGPTLDYFQMGPAQQVTGPNVQNYQMGPAQQVNAPNLQNYSMTAPGNVAPNGQVTTQSWTDPGVAQQYMNPYTSQVLDQQQKRMLQDWQASNQILNTQAAKAGAFGGSRQAVEQSTAARDMQDQMAMLNATGLQSAYQQGMGQFNTQQQLGSQAQQFNIQSGLQASLANQQAQQAAAQANLQSQLQTQGLGAQTGLQAQLANQAAGMQVGQANLTANMTAQQLREQLGQSAQMANQAAGLTVGQANLGANLQTQGLGANLGQQAALANQSQTYQQQVANQQAQEFTEAQRMQINMANSANYSDAMKANQQANLQGQISNQNTGFQSGLASMQMGQQGAQFNATQGQAADFANMQARMTAMGQQYQGGLQSGLQTQNLGMQGQIAGGQLNTQAGIAQEQARQAAMGFNLNAMSQQGQMANMMGNMGLAGYGANLQGLSAQQQAAMSQQGFLQQQADTNYQNGLQNMMTPMQAQMWYANMLAQQPVPYTTYSNGLQNTTSRGPIASPFSQMVGGAAAAAGSFMGAKKGGLLRQGAGGLEVVAGGKARKKKARRDPDALGLAAVRRAGAEHDA